MTEAAIPPDAVPDASAAPRIEHELIPFAVFLDYRARRMRGPVTTLPTTGAKTPPGIGPAES
jgi:hypothetical protein